MQKAHIKYKIAIKHENAQEIINTLSEVNGKSSAHAYTSFSDIFILAQIAEKMLEKLLIYKKHFVGARYVAISGAPVPNAYKYQRHATKVVLERTVKGWVLTDVLAETIWSDGGFERMHLTDKQDEQAIINLRTQYMIQKPTAAAPIAA